MKTFLSILHVKTNSYSNEKIALGLIAVTTTEVFYAYSNNKLSLANKCSGAVSISDFLKSILNQIQHTVNDSNKLLLTNQTSLLEGVSVFSKSYFDYLNKYNNGVLQFSDPVTINNHFTVKEFANYFNKFVGEPLTVDKPTPKKSFFQKLKPLFEKENLKQKADIDFHFNPVTFKGILKETNIPLITKNGNISTLQTIDFSTSANTITNHLYETQIIFNALNVFSKHLNCAVDKINIGFEEPAMQTDQHKLFDMAFIEYKDVFNFMTIDQVAAYTEEVATSTNVKFSSLLDL